MPETDDERSCGTSGALRPATANHCSLTVLGVVLLVWGIGPYIASFLYYLAQVVSWPLEPIRPVELLIGIGLLSVIPMSFVWRIPTATRWWGIGVGFLLYAAWYWRLVAWTLEIRLLHHITVTLRCFELDDRATIGLMMATLGLMLIGDNGWGLWILQRIWKTGSVAASWSRAHVKLVLMASLIGLWLVNPYRSHETCIQASEIAENLGAYRTAIAFTKLARDTFPTTTSCLNCRWDIDASLTRRIVYLECKSAGRDVRLESPDKGDRSGHETEQAPSWNAVIHRR